MACFADLPTEILIQVLEHLHPTYYDDVQTLQAARVNSVWANILYKGFRQKYEFLNEDFVKETWAYLTLPETGFLALMTHPYAHNPASKRASVDYSTVWVEDFKIQRRSLGHKDETKKARRRADVYEKQDSPPNVVSWSRFLSCFTWR